MSKIGLSKKVINILAHISAWGVFLLLPMLMRLESEHQHTHHAHRMKDLPIEGMLSLAFFMITFFYFNFWVLVPRLLNRRGIRVYGLAIFGLWVAFIAVVFFTKKLFFENYEEGLPILPSTFPFLLITTMSLSIRLLTDRAETEKGMQARENETLKSELAFLRSQISPHFLFNVMNTVVALSRLKPQLVEPTLIKLSGLMRYMLYEADEKKVTIEREIEYLESYIELQKLRFGTTVSIDFEKHLYYVNHQIEPMLLIPFVENAFKHGISLVQDPRIAIYFLINERNLVFKVFNKFDPLSIAAKDPHSGIGLRNVSRRLELLYGKNHALSVHTEGGIFEVQLTLFWNEDN